MYGVLGKEVVYEDQYDAQLLFGIPRAQSRQSLESHHKLCGQGHDIWNAYELSWLNQEGMPQVAVGRFTLPADSPSIIESKSFKLYLNSFNQSHFSSWEHVSHTMQNDLSTVAKAPVDVVLMPLDQIADLPWRSLPGICLDHQTIAIDDYSVSREKIVVKEAGIVEETVYSHLLRSNCPMTNQPDWGSILIQYKGQAICHQSLLRYIIGFRQHQGFHEHCVEQVFCDLMQQAHPESLSVHAFYTRRGGLDINPWRYFGLSKPDPSLHTMRVVRQ